MAKSVTQLSENSTLYTELRANANELLNYVSFASLKELTDAKSVLSKVTETETKTLIPPGTTTDTFNINEFLLSNIQPIPLWSPMKDTLGANTFIRYSNLYQPFADTNIELLKTKAISLVYHDAKKETSLTSVLTDISALFCTSIPPIEMSLCVPYFDMKIVYPASSDSSLDILKFIGASLQSAIETNIKTKYGTEVVGMEIFGMPQTLAPTSDSFKTDVAYKNRGLDILDPISPLLTLESAQIQQIGVAGGLDIQTKISLSMVLHDRSRLGDIEALVSASVFPTLSFRITYGWAHPDTNKMTGSVYAKLLNSMRVTQDFVVVSSSISTKSGSSLGIQISLSGAGSQASKSAKIISSSGQLINYGVIDSLIKQYIILKKGRPEKTSENFQKVGSTIISSVSSAASSTKYVPVDKFYDIYNKIKNNLTSESDFRSLVETLNSLTFTDINGMQSTFDGLFKFPTSTGVYSKLDDSIVRQPMSSQSAPFLTEDFANEITKISHDSGFYTNDTSPSKEDNVIPLAEMISRLIARPILASIPDVQEVRIHCFAFNSACGLMAEENIGNFPIVKNKFIEYKVEEEKERKINLNTSVASAMGLLLKMVNDPTSPFYGFSSNFQAAKKAADDLKAGVKDPKISQEQLQATLNDSYKSYQDQIDELNGKYLKDKDINFTDTSFVPARVKHTLEFLPAYDTEPNKLNPQHRIARITIYDERCGGFDKLGNLLFSMINSNGIARLISGGSVGILDGLTTKDQAVSVIKQVSEEGEDFFEYELSNKKIARQIASNLYPTLTIGAEGTAITNATYSTSPSGEVQSSYLLTALLEQGGASQVGDSTDSPLADDVFINPASLSISMLGNTCITRGQTYYVDFNTGTTLDNSYTVTTVSHSISPGKFTTSATLAPTNSASMKSVQKQVQELIKKITSKDKEIILQQIREAEKNKSLKSRLTTSGCIRSSRPPTLVD